MTQPLNGGPATPPVLYHVPPYGLERLRVSAPGGDAEDGGAVARRSWSFPGRSRLTPGQARRVLRYALCGWGVPDGVAEDVECIAAELVTNAVRHTKSARVEVAAVVEAGVVRLSVTDGGPYREVAPRSAGDEETRGRGLAIVAALCDRWGHEPSGPGPRCGTRVWAELDLGPSAVEAEDAPGDHEAIAGMVLAVLAPREAVPSRARLRRWHQVLTGQLNSLLPAAEERTEQLRRGRGPTLYQNAIFVIRSELTHGPSLDDWPAAYGRVQVMARQCHALLSLVTSPAGAAPSASAVPAPAGVLTAGSAPGQPRGVGRDPGSGRYTARPGVPPAAP
ncbi:DUF6415 family natural product biosynthesis protein [Streptomyces olivoreticuli]